MRLFPLFTVASLCLALSAFGSEPTYPKLFFKYSFLYDEACAGDKAPVDQSWAKEAKSRETEFTALWENGAPPLLTQLLKDFGRGFSRKEMTATLSVCPYSYSFSDPLVLNVTWYLKSYMKDKPVRPDIAFVDLVFHELMHTWLDENLKRPTPLLLKYKDEDPAVRSHLHLMAIQVLVYTELGRTDLLNWLDKLYPTIPGAYGRAWQIVTTEGYQAFVAELRN